MSAAYKYFSSERGRKRGADVFPPGKGNSGICSPRSCEGGGVAWRSTKEEGPVPTTGMAVAAKMAVALAASQEATVTIKRTVSVNAVAEVVADANHGGGKGSEFDEGGPLVLVVQEEAILCANGANSAGVIIDNIDGALQEDLVVGTGVGVGVGAGAGGVAGGREDNNGWRLRWWWR